MSLFSVRKMRQSPVLIGILVLLPVLSGCGGGGGGGGSSSTPPGNNTPPVVSLSAPPVDGLTATLSEDNSSIAVSGKVVYTEILKNTSSASIAVVPRVINGTDGPNVKLIIKDPSGTVVFGGGSQPAVDVSSQSHPNQSGPPSLPGSIALAPGQSLTQKVSVSVFTKHGPYSATATFTIVSSASNTVDSATVGPLKVTVK